MGRTGRNQPWRPQAKPQHGAPKVVPTDARNSSDGFAPGNVIFGKYEIVKLIGRGGMGSVYEVIDLRLQKNLALKILDSQVRDSQVAIRFQNEARNASRIVHSAIAKIYDFGVTDSGRPYMTVELLSGHTLTREIEENACLQINDFLRVFSDLCGALKAAHSVGIVHRDLKPENIIVYEDEQRRLRAKLLDFGISRRVDVTEEEAQRLTKTGQVIGTPLYMSPEQANGLSVDKKSDFYSLGCVMFFALTGAAPFRGDTAFETLRMHCEEDLPSLEETADGTVVPESLELLIRSLTAKDADDRPDSAEAIETALRQIATALEEELPPVEEAKIFRLPESSSQKLFKVGLGLLFVLLVGIASVFAWNLFSNSRPATEEIESNAIVREHKFFATGSDNSARREEERKRLQVEIDKHDQIINMQSSSLKDEDFEAVRKCKDIKQVNLDLSSNLTEDAVLNFSNNQNLETLSLVCTGIKSLKFIPAFPKLQVVEVAETPIGDEDLKVFKGRPVKRLDISRTEVTPRGIDYLKSYGFNNSSVVVSIKQTSEAKDGISYSELTKLIANGNQVVDTRPIIESLKNKALRCRQTQKLEADRLFGLIDKLAGSVYPVERANASYQRALIAGESKDDQKENFYLEQAAKYYLIGAKKDNPEIRKFSMERLAEVLIRQKRYSEPVAAEHEYLTRLDSNKKEDALLIAIIERKLGEQYMGKKHYAEAIRCFTSARQALSKMNTSTLLQQAELAGLMSACLPELGRSDEALPLALFAIKNLRNAGHESTLTAADLKLQRQILVNSYVGAVGILIAKHDYKQARLLNDEGLAYNANVHKNPTNQRQMESYRKMLIELSTKSGINH